MPFPAFSEAKTSSKSFGMIHAFAANTNSGLVRPYNEDRISIILNSLDPAKRNDLSWPLVNIFAVFDGHGGA